MTRKLYLSFVATALSFASIGAQAAIVNGVFSVQTPGITNLYSATLDGACTPSAAGEFFNCVPQSPPGLAVVVTNLGLGSGTLDIQYDNVTGEITQVNSMNFNLPDMDITISGALTGFITIRQGNNVPGANDFAFVNAGNATGVNNTVDPDEDFMFNTGPSVSLFQHSDAPNTDAPDFATFTDIVDTCVGTACPLIPVLGLDGVKYELAGITTGSVGDTFGLTVETANNSSYTLGLTIVPVPAAVWLFGSALGLLGWVRRRAV